jgi:hypothetical protein
MLSGIKAVAVLVNQARKIMMMALGPLLPLSTDDRVQQ